MNWKTSLIGILFSSAVIIVCWSTLIVPAGFLIALMIGITFFFIYQYLLREEVSTRNIAPLEHKEISVACLVMLSVVSVLLIPSVGESVEYANWNEIPALSLLRLLLATLLALFFPGYMILSILDKRGKLRITERIFFSVSTSLFMFPFLGLLCFALGSSIRQLGVSSIIILNLILLVPYVFFERNEPTASEKVSIDLHEISILFSLLVLMSVLMLSKYSLNLTWDYGDLDIYYCYAVSFTKDSLPLSVIGPGVAYPFWPFVFLGQFFFVSGVPYANAFQFISIPVTFLPILSFYVMVSAFFEKPRHRSIPIIATIFGFFGGGFGWIFGMNFLTSGPTVQGLYNLFSIAAGTDSGYLAPAFYSEGIYPFYTYALSSIFALIWLIFSKRAIRIGNLRYGLIVVMMALGYLAHIAETVFFVIVFLASVIVFTRENLSSYRKYSISIIFGLMFVGLADILIGGSYYTQGDPLTYYGFSLFYMSFALTAFAFFLSFAKGRPRNLHVSSPDIGYSRIRALKTGLLSLVVYFYGLCLIIWSIYFVASGSAYIQISQHEVPWFAWPGRLGTCGLLALIGVIYLTYKSKNVREYSFFIILVLVSFAVGRILHVYPFYFEDRLAFFIMIPIVILASYTLLKFCKSLTSHLKGNTRSVAIGFTLSIVLVSGFLPYTLLTNETMDLNYWSRNFGLGGQVTNLELDALNFLRLNTPANSSVLTVTMKSQRLLSYSGLSPVQTYVDRDPSIVLRPVFPESAIYSLVKSQVKYLYIGSADKNELEGNLFYSGYVRNYLLKYLTVAFKNEEVTIYQVPDFSIPTDSNTALVTPNLNISADDHTKLLGFSNNDSLDRIFSSLTIASLAQIEYSTVLDDDPARFHYFTLILTHDLNSSIEAEGRNLQAYLQWVNQGGRLIVLDSLGTYPSIGFANLLSLHTESTVKANGIKGIVGSWDFPSELTVPVISSNDTTVEDIAEYEMNDQPVSPYALEKRTGQGEIIYLLVSPYLSTLMNSPGDTRRDLFISMSSLLNVLDLTKNEVKWTNYFPQFDCIVRMWEGPIDLDGRVSIETDYIKFPRLNTSCVRILYNNGDIETTNLINSVMEDIEYGYPIRFRIGSSKTRLSGRFNYGGLIVDRGLYSDVIIWSNFTLNVEIPGNTVFRMSIRNGSILVNKTIQDATVQLNIDNNYTILPSVKNPEVTLIGHALLYGARIFQNHYKMPLFYSDGSAPLELIGNMKFGIQYSDDGIIFISNTTLEGKWFNIASDEQQSLTEMDIPWIEVLTSPFHLFLLIALCTVLIIRLYSTTHRKTLRQRH